MTCHCRWFEMKYHLNVDVLCTHRIRYQICTWRWTSPHLKCKINSYFSFIPVSGRCQRGRYQQDPRWKWRHRAGGNERNQRELRHLIILASGLHQILSGQQAARLRKRHGGRRHETVRDGGHGRGGGHHPDTGGCQEDQSELSGQ